MVLVRVAKPMMACVLVFGCGGRSAESPASDSPYGTWVAQVPPSTCAMEVTLLPDGRAVRNFLNDDSPERQCSFEVVEYQFQAPGVLVFTTGGDPVRQCQFRHDGGSLWLACDEHQLPKDLQDALEFGRAPSAPAGEIQGRFRGTSLLGSSSAFVFHDDGRLEMGGMQGSFQVVDAETLDLTLSGFTERCSTQWVASKLILGCTSYRQAGLPGAVLVPEP